MELLDPNRPRFLLTDAPVHSYRRIAALYKATFDRVGLPITLADDTPDVRASIPAGAIVFHNTIGPKFAPMAGATNIALPAHEWSRYPAAWGERLNRFDQIWVTSHHVATTLARSGVTVKAETLPPGLVDEEHIPAPPWEPGRPYSFYAVGEAHFRKGFHLLMEGFVRAFPQEGAATLTIKTLPPCDWVSPRDDIRIVSRFLSDEELAQMVRKADACVTATLGEGLDLPIAEAVALGIPVTASFWGGHTSILCDGGFTPMAFEEVTQPYCSRPDYHAPGQTCAYSSPDAVADALRRTIDLSEDQRVGMVHTAFSHLAEGYGFAVTARRIAERFGR